ncbi:MAG TPA: FixH family protein [Polyangiaceae bacterium]
MRFASTGTSVLVALVLTACSSSGSTTSSGDFPADAYATTTSDSGKYDIEVRFAPAQPPSPGTSSAKLTITDAATKKPVEGATFSMVPWMPSMGHGASVMPTITDEGDGSYLADNVTFFMQGQWQLRVTFQAPDDDHANIDVAVP